MRKWRVLAAEAGGTEERVAMLEARVQTYAGVRDLLSRSNAQPLASPYVKKAPREYKGVQGSTRQHKAAKGGKEANTTRRGMAHQKGAIPKYKAPKAHFPLERTITLTSRLGG